MGAEEKIVATGRYLYYFLRDVYLFIYYCIVCRNRIIESSRTYL